MNTNPHNCTPVESGKPSQKSGCCYKGGLNLEFLNVFAYSWATGWHSRKVLSRASNPVAGSPIEQKLSMISGMDGITLTPVNQKDTCHLWVSVNSFLQVCLAAL